MSDITLTQLQHIMLRAVHRAEEFLQPLVSAMNQYGITTVPRQAAFLAQVSYESAELLYMKEIASGAAYEGRHDLGNTQTGDGVKYKGRGLIQITGHANYALCGRDLGLDLITYPEKLEEPKWACLSAAWFWAHHGLNELADKSDFVQITRRINGGTDGLPLREVYWRRAKEVLGGPGS